MVGCYMRRFEGMKLKMGNRERGNGKSLKLSQLQAFSIFLTILNYSYGTILSAKLISVFLK